MAPRAAKWLKGSFLLSREGVQLVQSGNAGIYFLNWSVQHVSDVAFIRLGTAQLQFPVPLFGATAGLFP